MGGPCYNRRMSLSLTEALIRTGSWLIGAEYRFTTVTPSTHSRVNARPGAQTARTLAEVFGWSRPFAPALLAPDALAGLREADLLDTLPGNLLRSRVRFSSLGGALYAHSAHPTTQADAVFFGPDTCRFVTLIESELQRQPLGAGARVLDVGCGGGPGGIAAVRASHAAAPALVLADISPVALQFARANAALAAVANVHFAQGDLFAPTSGPFDLIVANPPYLLDAAARTYRHGGGALGGALSERIVAEGLPRLAPGGRLVLYTGSAIVAGVDALGDAVRHTAQATGWPWHYRELDPDVFGEELDTPAYAHAERIAAVALVVQRPVK